MPARVKTVTRAIEVPLAVADEIERLEQLENPTQVDRLELALLHATWGLMRLPEPKPADLRGLDKPRADRLFERALQVRYLCRYALRHLGDEYDFEIEDFTEADFEDQPG